MTEIALSKPAGSYAVMAQRAEARDSLDDFPTPPWATRALCEHVLFRIGTPDWNKNCPQTVAYRFALGDAVAPQGRLVPPKFPVAGLTVWEPACNRGFMARPLAEYFENVIATDVHDYGWPGQEEVLDFLFPGGERGCDWVISNPPFRLAQQFIEHGLTIAKMGAAFLVRTAFLESVGRYDELFRRTPPAVIAQFSERVPMVKGRCDPDASTATSYCWLVFLKDQPVNSRFVWIPPCRRILERAGDYSIAEVA